MNESTKKPKEIITVSDSPVQVTLRASKFILHMANMSESQPNLALKVLPGGCAGMKYSMDFIADSDVRSTDVRVDCGEVNIYIDSDSLDFLAGAVIDTDDDLMSPGLKIDNPNAKRGCGCGKSFG